MTAVKFSVAHIPNVRSCSHNQYANNSKHGDPHQNFVYWLTDTNSSPPVIIVAVE